MYLLVLSCGPYGRPVWRKGGRGLGGGCRDNDGARDKHEEGNKAMEVEEREGEGSDHEQMRTGWDRLHTRKAKKKSNINKTSKIKNMATIIFQPIQWVILFSVPHQGSVYVCVCVCLTRL